MPVRILNAFFAALFLVGMLISFAFLAAAGESGLWLPAASGAAMAALASLCFANLRMAAGERRSALLAANIGALLLTGAGLLLPDPAAQWAGGVSAIPFAATSLALILRPRPA